MARQKQMSINLGTPLAMGPAPLGETPPSIGSPAATVPAKVKVATFVCPT